MSAGRRSGTNTPLSARSRNSSAENLGSMGTVSSLFETLSNNANIVLGSRSRNRNRNRDRDRDRNPGSDLEVSSEEVHGSAASDTTVEQGSSNAVHTPLASSVSPGNISSIVQQTIPENPPPPTETIRTSDPPPMEYDSVELSKCPSYNTARRVRPHGPINDGLPSYEAAISTPRSSVGRAEPALTGASAAYPPQGRQPEQEVQAVAEAHSRTLEERLVD